MSREGARIKRRHLPYELNRSSIKFYVRKYLLKRRADFQGKKILDFPAGNGITSKIIQEIGGVSIAFDLFPQNFSVIGIHCKRADIREGLPLPPNSVDHAICQEGIEHFADQLGALRELNRVLKTGGSLLVTTPNYSNMKSRVSYLLNESENYSRLMPPNEVDSIWFSDGKDKDLYFGHIFLTGFFKLRLLAKLAGFTVERIYYTRSKASSILLFLVFYPFLFFQNWLNYRKNLRKTKRDNSDAKLLYGELFRYAISPRILLDGHLMVEFRKENRADKVAQTLRGKLRKKKFVS